MRGCMGMGGGAEHDELSLGCFAPHPTPAAPESAVPWNWEDACIPPVDRRRSPLILGLYKIVNNFLVDPIEGSRCQGLGLGCWIVGFSIGWRLVSSFWWALSFGLAAFRACGICASRCRL